jgi:hypothetical protein
MYRVGIFFGLAKLSGRLNKNSIFEMPFVLGKLPKLQHHTILSIFPSTNDGKYLRNFRTNSVFPLLEGPEITHVKGILKRLMAINVSFSRE